MNYLHHWSKYSATQNYSKSYTLFKTDKPTNKNPNKSKQTKNRDSKGKPQKGQTDSAFSYFWLGNSKVIRDQ